MLLNLIALAPLITAQTLDPSGRCGLVNGKVFDCLPGECCSQYGYCGTGSDYCSSTRPIPRSTSVQTPTPTSKPPTTTVKAGTTSAQRGGPTELPTLASGQCGLVNGKVYGCGTNECCSEYGYCGSGTQYCNAKSIDLGVLAGGSGSTVVVTSTVGGGTDGGKTVAGPLPTKAPAVSSASKATVIGKCIQPGMIAMTFDDGPSANIPSLLAKLDQLGVKATFFVNANNYADFVDPNSADAAKVKSIFDKGHQIGTHTFSHADLATLSVQGIWDQMRLNDEAIRRIIGVRPTHLRAPFLSTNDQMLTAVGSFGYKVIGVTLDTKDYEHTTAGTQIQLNLQNVNTILKGVNSGTSSFISLNHDFTSQIAGWMDVFVPLMKRLGYRFVTSAECVGDANPYRQ